MTVPRANDQSQPTSQAPHQHPGASFAQLMNQLIYHPFGSTLSPSSEAMIIGRLDSIQGEMASINQAISRLQETVNLLVERQGQPDVASGVQIGGLSDDEAEELPLAFVRQPRNGKGKVRNSTKSDVEAAILALVNRSVEEQQKKLAGINKHLDTVLERMKMEVPENKRSDSWTLISESSHKTAMKMFLDSVAKSHPFVPLDECERNWIACHVVIQKWNNFHGVNPMQSTVVTNDSQQRDEVTGLTGGAMSICSSMQSREIVRQLSAPRTNASGPRPAALPPALTREVSMHSISTSDNASANSRATHSNTLTIYHCKYFEPILFSTTTTTIDHNPYNKILSTNSISDYKNSVIIYQAQVILMIEVLNLRYP
ncbi:hypothetical protein BDC45DRAFT_593749, partial [Circinella umbellata]